MVHASSGTLPADLIGIPVEIPDAITSLSVDAAGLPPGWQISGDTYCANFGDQWYDSGIHPLLDAPSAVLPLERNIMLNTQHTDFKSINTTHGGYPIRFDPRILALLTI
jgi:RES domain-containing protein